MIKSEHKEGNVETVLKGTIVDVFREFTSVAHVLAGVIVKAELSFIPDNVSPEEAVLTLASQGIRNDGIFYEEDFVQHLKQWSESLSENGE